MKEGWRYLRLGDVCEFMSGYTPSKNVLSKLGDVPYYKVSDMNAKGNESYMISTLLYVSNPRKIFPKGSIVFPKNGGAIFTNKKRILSFDSVIDLNTEAIVPNAQYVTTDFLYKLLLDIDLSQFDNGGGLPSINIRKMQSHEVLIPPVSEQERLVSFLDAQFAKIDAIKANAEKQLQEAKALFQNALKDLLTPKEGWEEKLLKNILLDSENIRWQDVDKNKEYGYIDLTSVSRETKEVISPSIINSSNAPSRAKQIVKSGDLIFATTRPTLRRFCLISDVYDSQICSTGFCLLRPNKQILSSFLFYILFSDDFYFYIEPLQTGASYPAVSDNIVKNYTIYLPSILEQEKIVEKLDELREKITQLQSNYSQTVTLCEDLKKSLLKDIFS